MQDDDNLREALRYSAAMLGELRTSQLTPQKYFELYMQTFTELQHLEVRLIRAVDTAEQSCVLQECLDAYACLCRCSSKRSTRRGVNMQTSMSWSSMLAMFCRACKLLSCHACMHRTAPAESLMFLRIKSTR